MQTRSLQPTDTSTNARLSEIPKTHCSSKLTQYSARSTFTAAGRTGFLPTLEAPHRRENCDFVKWQTFCDFMAKAYRQKLLHSGLQVGRYPH